MTCSWEARTKERPVAHEARVLSRERVALANTCTMAQGPSPSDVRGEVSAGCVVGSILCCGGCDIMYSSWCLYALHLLQTYVY